MKFSFRIGIYLVFATTIAMLITIGGAYQLSVAEQVEQANAEAKGQRILAKLEELVSASEAVESATLSYIISRSEQNLQRLRETEANRRIGIAQLAQLVTGDAGQQRRAAALDVAAITLADLQLQATRLRPQQGVAAAVSFISSAAYRSSEREVERLLRAMRQQEHALDSARHEGIAARTRQLGQLTLWSGLLAIGLALFAATVINRERRERRLAEVHLRASEERWKFVLEGAGEGVWDRNIQADEVLYSKRCKEMLGFADGEFQNRRDEWVKRIHPQDKRRVMADLQTYLDGNSPAYSTECRLLCKDGSWKWILTRGVVVSRDASGRALRMTGTIADISARKEIERMKNEFISMVSHELRTPLSSIVGSLGLLVRMTDLREDIQTLIRVARENSQRLVRLINDILDVEKLDSGKLQIQLEPVDLEALLDTAIQAKQGYADQYGVSLVRAGSQGPAWVDANFDRLMQVMANLLSNAAKFSPRGARVEVHLQRTRSAFRVSVVDPGPGIPEEFKPHVFDRFAQADSSTSRQRGGAGLGLAICKMIIDKLGGKIGFVSAPGLGTTFYFVLPPLAQAVRLDMQDHGAMRI